MAIQINGKTRDIIDVEKGYDQVSIENLVFCFTKKDTKIFLIKIAVIRLKF